MATIGATVLHPKHVRSGADWILGWWCKRDDGKCLWIAAEAFAAQCLALPVYPGTRIVLRGYDDLVGYEL